MNAEVGRTQTPNKLERILAVSRELGHAALQSCAASEPDIDVRYV